MSTNVTWNGNPYIIPSSGEINWQALSAFLVDLGNNAQTTNFQKFGARIALTTPVSIVSTDTAVMVALTVPGATAVTLTAGSNGRCLMIADGAGDAATNPITITPNGVQTINGAATYVINKNFGAVTMIFSGTNWSVVSSTLLEGQIDHTQIQNIGSNTHAQIDTHIANTNNPHGVGGSQLSNNVPITKGGTNQSTKTAGFDALSPVTAKGDLIVRDGGNNVNLPLGIAGQVLTVDLAQATGLKYSNPLVNPMDGVGQLIKGGALGAATKLPLGAANEMLGTNAGATDLAYTLILNANIHAGAAIAITKLAKGTAYQVLVTNAAGTATEYKHILNAHIDAAAGIQGSKVIPNFVAQLMETTNGISFNSGTTLDAYQVTSGNLDGDFSAGTYEVVRIGKQVTVTIKGAVHANTSLIRCTSTGIVIAADQPSTTAYNLAYGDTNGPINMSVTPDGKICIIHLNTSFGARAATGFADILTTTYTLIS